ncbi:hypothetical protein [Thermovibrio sp.]
MIRGRLKEKRFFDVIYPVSEDRVIIEAPHAGGPKREYYTGYIAVELCDRYGWGGIISRTSRLIVDFNRDEEFRAKFGSYQREGIEARNGALKKLVNRLNWEGSSPLLYLTLHGVSDENANSCGGDFIVGTINGQLCPLEFRDGFTQRLSQALKTCGAPHRGVKEVRYSGDPSLIEIKRLFGEKFYLIQLELSKELRERFTDEIISSLFLAVKGTLRELR